MKKTESKSAKAGKKTAGVKEKTAKKTAGKKKNELSKKKSDNQARPTSRAQTTDARISPGVHGCSNLLPAVKKTAGKKGELTKKKADNQARPTSRAQTTEARISPGVHGCRNFLPQTTAIETSPGVHGCSNFLPAAKKAAAKLDELRYSDGERAMLREKQLELAFGGDRQMLIWLGKAVLGQTPAAAPRGGEDGETVIVLTPDEAVALYGPGGEGKGGE